jgi:hypothetical protein
MADESEVTTGHESEFWLGNGATPSVLTELAEVTEVPLPEGAAELYETSHMKTTGYKSYKAAPLKEGAEADIVMNYIPGSATDVLCRGAKASGDERPFKIVLKTEDGTWEITGFCVVRNYVRSNPMEDRRTATLTVKWTSDETEAAGD